MKKSKEQIEEEKQEKREIAKAHRALDDLIDRAKQKGAFIEEQNQNYDRNIRKNETTDH